MDGHAPAYMDVLAAVPETSPPRGWSRNLEIALLKGRSQKLARILDISGQTVFDDESADMQKRTTRQGIPGLEAVCGDPRAANILTNGKSLTAMSMTLVTLGLFATLLAGTASASGLHSHQAIIDAAVRHIENSPAASTLGGVEVSAKPLDPRLRLASCDEALSTFDPYESPIRQKMTVGVACEGSSPWKIFVPVSVSAHTHVVVLTRGMPRGARLGKGDVRVEKRKIFPGSQPLLSSTTDAIGQTLVRGLSSGAVLTTGLVRPPKVVSRGDKITLVVSYHSLEVRSAGTALQDGTVGQKIAATNVDSRRTVEGWVQTDGSVRVSR